MTEIALRASGAGHGTARMWATRFIGSWKTTAPPEICNPPPLPPLPPRKLTPTELKSQSSIEHAAKSPGPQRRDSAARTYGRGRASPYN
ncbi:hypothetical protein EVAR_76283_1 [Eumeta japonica]|uniref:Uncharacterized protein n=1 Tax=Eumeta variegata TaxID=151549 RepID=A0A4C1UP14_EUMVA|nr:hypothetical protein EVAR_76283_1 [Eumeta japonica]